MPPRNTDKNKDVLKELEKTISPVLVVNNSSLKPYVELFEYEPENIYQQPLGSLVGFFEVKEYSDESAYVVNFLTSVLKKEYYINPKRQVTESLDSALHKVNMALSELAKNGNVEWLGKIHAAICVLEKNNAHFSVAGNAKIFLFRNQALSEISADLASDSLEPHPLKTFVNVSSGRLEKNDRMLITSEDIFHILPVAELKKNFHRFQGDKFVQFLKTALSNQMEMIASVVVDMTEPIPVAKAKAVSRAKQARTLNAFSETAFSNNPAPVAAAKDAQQQEPTEADELTSEQYTDQKTGHIYIQGEVNENQESTNAQMHLYMDIAKEKLSNGLFVVKNEMRKRFSLYKKQLAKKRELRKIEREKQLQLEAEQAKILEEQKIADEMLRKEKLAEEQELELIRLEKEQEAERIRAEKDKMEQAKSAIETAPAEKPLQKQAGMKNVDVKKIVETQEPEKELTFMEKLRLAKMEYQRDGVINLSIKEETVEDETAPLSPEPTPEPKLKIETVKKDELAAKPQDFKMLAIRILEKFSPTKDRVIFSIKETYLKLTAKESGRFLKDKFENIVPHFSKIKNLFARFTSKQKMYALGALALIFIVPLFIVRFMDKPQTPVATEVRTTPPTKSEILSNDKNIRIDAPSESIYSNSKIIATLVANGNSTVITDSSVVVLQNNQPKEFALPADSGAAVRAAYMEDLSLVLVLTDKSKVLSFSPISTKFTDNRIDLAGISPESLIGTYLTYMYVLDQKTNQIYRYPRAEGGFGNRINWLKDSTPLSDVSSMTIDDNIYAIQEDKVLKFFKGVKTEFTLESSNTPVHFDLIQTTSGLQAIYVLDKENSRIVQYSKDGSITAQFHNDDLQNGTSLSVDEKNKVAHVATSSELISVSLQ